MDSNSFDFSLFSEGKEMSNGMRMLGNTPLSKEEIEIVKQAIHVIEAEESIFIFNDSSHLSNTCYNEFEDSIYIGRNVFPDVEYGSTHPRDIMSIRAVLAHEYYGHRTYRDEYLKDYEKNIITTPKWQDECRASITAAKISPGLTQMDRSHLIQDAVKRAEEYGQWIKTDDFMKEVLYGYPSSKEERNITPRLDTIIFVRAESQDGNDTKREGFNKMPKVRKHSKRENRGPIR